MPKVTQLEVTELGQEPGRLGSTLALLTTHEFSFPRPPERGLDTAGVGPFSKRGGLEKSPDAA